MTDPISAPLAAWKGSRRAYVVPEKKLVYISLAKNACTSLKWAVAEIAGEDLGRFRAGLTSGTTPEDGIHDAALWSRTPTFADLEPSVRADIQPGNGWFIF